VEEVVRGLGGDVEVKLDAVAARVVGFERLLGGCRIALLRCVDGVHQRRAPRLDAGDLEAFLRGRLSHHAKDGQGREQGSGNAAHVLHHGGTSSSKARRLTGRSRGRVSYSLTKLQERDSESCRPMRAQLVIISIQENCWRPEEATT